jgi:hypothetical protein
VGNIGLLFGRKISERFKAFTAKLTRTPRNIFILIAAGEARPMETYWKYARFDILFRSAKDHASKTSNLPLQPSAPPGKIQE